MVVTQAGLDWIDVILAFAGVLLWMGMLQVPLPNRFTPDLHLIHT